MLVCLGCTLGLSIGVLYIYFFVCLLKRNKTSNMILKDEAMDFENRRSLGMIGNQGFILALLLSVLVQ